MIIKNINNTDTVISCSYFHLNFKQAKRHLTFNSLQLVNFNLFPLQIITKHIEKKRSEKVIILMYF